ncbi:agamous-like MADS-box protein AGL29 [Nicotiana tabacum]|uniref:Agamous-like MADS-box protein AGL29 n=2 Tax=Nicotiana TaxID=4085 RepID=A0A1S4B548_TOBAC|nr:PREDICTED: agamous-like MADS-box protein AGL61 [Nicotiana sylvestris]
MARRTSRGRQKIEMKYVESKEARYVTFSKRKASLFRKADEFSTVTGADVGVLLFSPSGKPCSYTSTSVEKITEKFREWKQQNADEGKSSVFQAFDDLCKDIQDENEKAKSRELRYKVMYPGAEIPADKERLEKFMEMKLRLENINEATKNHIRAERLKFDLNVVPEYEVGESSGTHH